MKEEYKEGGRLLSVLRPSASGSCILADIRPLGQRWEGEHQTGTESRTERCRHLHTKATECSPPANGEAAGRPAGADSHEAHTGTRQRLTETPSRSYREELGANPAVCKRGIIMEGRPLGR